MDKRIKYAFFQGNIVPISEAKISIMTHGFMYATSIFEGIRAYYNADQKRMYILRLREHLERMYDSMKIMFLELPYSIDDLIKIITDLLKKETIHSRCLYKNNCI